MHETSRAGLYRSESLSILNEVFKSDRITDRTPTERIDDLYKKVAQRIEGELGIQRERFYRSALYEWPLYHFVAAGF